MFVVAQAVWAVFVVHKDNLPTQCSTRTDVCVWLPRQSGQSLLSTRTISLLSAQQGLMCVWLPRQSGQSLLSTWKPPTKCSTRTDVFVVAQAVWTVFVVHKDNLPT